MNHRGTQRINTDRLLLRPFAMTDAEAMYRHWAADADACRFWSWEPHATLEETRRVLHGWMHQYANREYYHWVIVLKEIAEAIGYIYLNEIDNDARSAAMHFLVGRQFWNRGIMTEACRAVLAFSFRDIGMRAMHSRHHADNPASGTVMRKAGMRYVDTRYRAIPECARISGDYCYYAMTLDDWRAISGTDYETLTEFRSLSPK